MDLLYALESKCEHTHTHIRTYKCTHICNTVHLCLCLVKKLTPPPSTVSPQNVSRAFSPDQQFLSNFFSAAAEAPMFNAAKGPSTEKFNRLPFQYSVPGFYFIEKVCCVCCVCCVFCVCVLCERVKISKCEMWGNYVFLFLFGC